MPSFSGGSLIEPHGFDDAQNGGDDTQGGQGVGHALQGMRRLERIVMVFFELGFHRRLDLMGIVEVHGRHAERVADEIDREMVLRDPGIALKNLAFIGFFDVRLQRHDTARLDQLGQREQQRQQILVVLLLPL